MSCSWVGLLLTRTSCADQKRPSRRVVSSLAFHLLWRCLWQSLVACSVHGTNFPWAQSFTWWLHLREEIIGNSPKDSYTSLGSFVWTLLALGFVAAPPAPRRVMFFLVCILSLQHQ